MISFDMRSQCSPAIGLQYLLGLNGNIEVQNDAGYWVKMEVSSVDVTAERPHGIRYSLTLHAPDNTRLIGFDNAHSVRPAGSRFKHAGKRFPYDHRHRHAMDEGVLYEFETAYQLVSDFYAEVDRVLKEVSP
jgi:outer membrane receptor for Fe3+-dicitrate